MLCLSERTVKTVETAVLISYANSIDFVYARRQCGTQYS